MKWKSAILLMLLPIATMEGNFDRKWVEERYAERVRMEEEVRKADLEQRFSILLDGVLYKETRHGRVLVTKQSIKEGAVGVLQIRKGMVSYLNNLGGDFSLADRKDSLRSVEMFRRLQERVNPSFDLDTGCHVWNAGPNRLKERWHLTEGYREEVRAYLKKNGR